MLKVLIATTASIAIVSAAAAADLPRPQPVPQAVAPVGKAPIGIPIIGKLPVIGKIPVIGKYPYGKTPTAAPVITKG